MGYCKSPYRRLFTLASGLHVSTDHFDHWCHLGPPLQQLATILSGQYVQKGNME